MAERDEPEPYALTEQHLAGLVRAIHAEGYRILVDTETNAVRLERIQCNRPPSRP